MNSTRTIPHAITVFLIPLVIGACIVCLGAAPAHAYAAKIKAGNAATYQIVYKLSGGVNPQKQIRAVAANKTLSVSKFKKPTRKGYTFAGWYKNEKRTKRAISVKGVKSKARRTLYAKWIANTYTITYNVNGGLLDSAVPVTYTVATKIKLPTPKRPGYAFLGWYSNGRLTKPVDVIAKGTTGNKTFYARWRKRLLVAHRGYHDAVPGNSAASIRLAREKGFDYVELDVRFTKDDVPVMAHDADIKVYALGNDGQRMKISVPISSLTYSQLQAILFVNAATGLDGENILSFDECLSICNEVGLQPIIHMKDHADHQIDILVQAVEYHGLSQRIRWFSNAQAAIQRVIDYDSSANVLYSVPTITKDKVTFARELADGGADVIMAVKLEDYTYDHVRLCKDARLPLCLTGLANEAEARLYSPYLCMYFVDGLEAPSAAEAIPE